MPVKSLKTRFCPSPTGLLHMGNVRTALFNALLAKGQGGSFLLRIEDTDEIRSKDEYTEALQHDLRWLGLIWDDGPYYQSKRQEIYQQYFEQIIARNLAYPCFCSEVDLAQSRQAQLAAGLAPRYSGTCAHLTGEEIEDRHRMGLKPALRFRVPVGQWVIFIDGVRGEQKFLTDDIGDFIVRRHDGSASFMFCNAVDDALMNVTHALRGEDHLTNTPRQLLILQALNLPAPKYHHISLIVGRDGAPLAKRHGSMNVGELREQGYLPIAVVNYLAHLGHRYDDEGFQSYAQLATNFQTERLSHSPAKFDIAHLHYFQKAAVSELSVLQAWEWMKSSTQGLVPQSLSHRFAEVVKANIMLPNEALFWAKALFGESLDFSDEAQEVLSKSEADFFVHLKQVIENSAYSTSNFLLESDSFIENLKQATNLKGKALFQPLRAVLTGCLSGPTFSELFELMSKETLLKRVSGHYKT